jgi:hypothetical protein
VAAARYRGATLESWTYWPIGVDCGPHESVACDRLAAAKADGPRRTKIAAKAVRSPARAVIRRTDNVRGQGTSSLSAGPLTRSVASLCHPRPQSVRSTTHVRRPEAVRATSRGARGLARPSLPVLARVAVAAKTEEGD